MKVVFKHGHEEMGNGLTGGSLHLSQVNKEQETVFYIQEDLTSSQHKLYRFCRMPWFRGWWKGYTRFRMLSKILCDM
jgi:hypothetical protein